VRRIRREPALKELDLADEVWRQFAADDAGDAWIEALRACVERLSGRGREAIELQYHQEQSREQIARRLEMTPDGVKTLLRRTREVLRQCVERKVKEE
jgi:RNA polymerase sigma-70 factor (ECF subfamily)